MAEEIWARSAFVLICLAFLGCKDAQDDCERAGIDCPAGTICAIDESGMLLCVEPSMLSSGPETAAGGDQMAGQSGDGLSMAVEPEQPAQNEPASQTMSLDPAATQMEMADDIGGRVATCPDADMDGYQDAACNPNAQNMPPGGDCDDANNAVHPGRQEDCSNQVDNNCNSLFPDRDPACLEACPDADGDGFQDAVCNSNPTNGADCDDGNPLINPQQDEVCGNGFDDDCQDGDLRCLMNCRDADNDGFGPDAGCYGPDCNDGDPSISPWGSEVCGDGIDQDCDGRDSPCIEGCTDVDGDRFGPSDACLGFDCNDRDVTINPAAREVPNDGIDQDCNGADLIYTAECRNDLDRDGYGSDVGCLGLDCNDNDPRIHPGRMELCANGLDDDCQGGDAPCEGSGNLGFGEGDCVDRDGDGWGSGGCLLGRDDCNDADPFVNPGVLEQCNGVDDNCNGEIDECGQRNQECIGGACLGFAGAPCSTDDECYIGDGFVCNPEIRQCRLDAGLACTSSSDCNPSASCSQNQECGLERRCLGGVSGVCQEDCDCQVGLRCHPSGRCMECIDNEDCPGEEQGCSAGGYCVDGIIIGEGSDALLDLLIAITDCWTRWQDSRAPQGCGELILASELRLGERVVGGLGPSQALLDEPECTAQYCVCDRDSLTAASAGDPLYATIDVELVRDLFGCERFGIIGFIDFNRTNIYWSDVLLSSGLGSPRCMYFSPTGYLDVDREAIVISGCGISNFE